MRGLLDERVCSKATLSERTRVHTTTDFKGGHPPTGIGIGTSSSPSPMSSANSAAAAAAASAFSSSSLASS